jgi:hypothetical protein
MVLSRLHKAYRVVFHGEFVGINQGGWGEVQTSTPNANDKPGERMLTRMSPHALAMLEKRLPPPLLGNDPNDPIYAGYALGCQRVLKELREGFQA